MSNATFPVLKGLRWDVVKMPRYNTNVQTMTSGHEQRFAYMQFPLWEFHLSFSVLRAAASLKELQTLMGFFIQMKGRYDSWLYTDPDDSSVTDEQFGVRDGVTTQYQLSRTFGYSGYTMTEAVCNVNAITNVKSNGVTMSTPADYTINDSGRSEEHTSELQSR